MRPISRAASPSEEEGALLIEFALIAFVLYLLFAATVGFGRAVQYSQVAQDVARLGARELALTPLPAGSTFEQALETPGVRTRLYDPTALVIDLDAVQASGRTLDEVFAGLPLINRALRPAMIFETVLIDETPRRLLRAPGAILRSREDPTQLTVGVPLVVSRDGDGVETIRWLSVVEEVRLDPSDPATGPFSITSTGPDQGLVALRVNLPFQASALTSFEPTRLGGDPSRGNPSQANDNAVVQLDQSPDGTLAGAITPEPGVGVYAGRYGLGRQFALATTVRPFRRVVSGQAFFRREVFADF